MPSSWFKILLWFFRLMKVKPEKTTTVEDGADVSQSDNVTTTIKSCEPCEPPPPRKYLWCLDAGHGNDTSGKRSPKMPDGSQLHEWEFNYDIVFLISELLDLHGVAHYIVKPEISDVALMERVRRVNEHPSKLQKIFVSIHANAAPTAKAAKGWQNYAHGAEVWHYFGSGQGEHLAKTFQRHIVQKTGLRDRGIKSRPQKQFTVLARTEMPVILTENGFFNNVDEVKKLLDPKFREAVAQAHVNAILEYEGRYQAA